MELRYVGLEGYLSQPPDQAKNQITSKSILINHEICKNAEIQ